MRRTVAGRSIGSLLCASLLVWSLVAAAGFAAENGAAPQRLHIAGLDVAAWLPSRDTPGPWPIIIFSHGFHGCNTQSIFLMEGLAGAGYAVFAPKHRDAACGNIGVWFTRPEAPFRDPRNWTDATFADRAEDIERRWKDARVKAVLALSPYAAPFIWRKTLAGIGAPVMYQGGTRDYGITPFVNKGEGAYDQTPAPKYFVDFDDAGHFAWTNLRGTYHAAIVDYSVAFLDRYLKA